MVPLSDITQKLMFLRCWRKQHVSKPPSAIWPCTSWILGKTKLQELPAVGTTKTTMGLISCQNTWIVINKHCRGQRAPLAVGLRMLRCGRRAGLDNGGYWGGGLKSGNRDSWTSKILITCYSIAFCRTAEQWDKLHPNKEKQHLLLT